MLNRKGYGFIWTCVLIVMLVMILSALMSVAETVSSVRHFKREITTALEAYSTTESIRIYSSIKNGNDRIGTPDNALFQQYLVSYCHLQSSPKGYVCLTSDHVERFQMSIHDDSLFRFIRSYRHYRRCRHIYLYKGGECL